MHPSLILLPLPELFFVACNHLHGPQTTMECARHIAQAIYEHLPVLAKVQTENVANELRLAERVLSIPWGTCLEFSCAVQIWFAIHGQRSEICLGKRLQDGRLLMHAWIKTERDTFFEDSRFETCFHAL